MLSKSESASNNVHVYMYLKLEYMLRIELKLYSNFRRYIFIKIVYNLYV